MATHVPNGSLQRQMRGQGFADGRVGRKPRWPADPIYNVSFKRGIEARQSDAKENGR